MQPNRQLARLKPHVKESLVRFAAMFLQFIALCGVSIALSSPRATEQNRTSPVTVGEMAPDFTLADHQGQKITLSEARAKSPVIIVFYRGYW